MKKIQIFSFFLMTFLVSGCSTKSSDGMFNLPPEAWQEQIIDDLKSADFQKADEHYTSFSSEHVASPLLEDTLLIIAQAYMRNEDYAKANEYIDRYIIKYGNLRNIEFAQFLKIKANYESFLTPNRNQALMQNSLIQISQFLKTYPNSIYRPMIETMQIKFKLALYYLEQNIRDLYKRTGKEESAKIYEQRLMLSNLEDANIVPPKIPWYRAFFE